MKPLAEEDSQSELLKNQGGNDINATKNRDYSSIIDEKAIVRKKRIKWGIIGGLILIAVILAIVLPITLSKKKDDDHPTPTPGPPGPDPPAPPPPIPDHFNPYSLDPADVQDNQATFSGVIKGPNKYNQELHLRALNNIIPTLKDGTKKFFVDSKGIPQGENNKFVGNVNFQFDMKTWRVAHLSMTDKDNARFKVPEVAVPTPAGNNPDTMRLEMLGFKYNLSPFSFSFVDPTNPQNTFISTKDQSLVVMDKFIQMDFTLPSQKVFGLGERIRDFGLDEGTWTMWSIGLDSPYDDGTGRKGVYGVHPFMMVQTQTKGDYIGLFFKNSNAQSPILKFNDDGTSTLSYITIGGEIDIYFFIHGTAKEIIQQYQQYFGLPNLPPFWSFGWQQASWKYQKQDDVTDVLDNYAANGFPLETIYLDIPYMNKYADFTVDTKNFPDLPGLSKRLQANGQRLVVIIDAALSAEDVTDKNKYYTMGNGDNVFIKSSLYNSAKYNGNLISKVWPETAVFIDWFNDKCMNVWSTGLKDLYDLVKYDGLWIDMNEPTTFQDGEKIPEDITPPAPSTLKQQAENDNNHDYSWYYKFADQSKPSTYDLPFIPRFDPTKKGDPYSGNWDFMTLSLNSTVASLNEKEYNVHSLYGHMMSKRTHQFMTTTGPNPDNRPFILTRSTFAGTGKYASHWLGDNWRDWDYMKYSIGGIMNMNMFGIPQAGADVCGFFGEKKDDEMCARWVQLATFYPLARAHQNLTWKDGPSDRSEPYLLEGKYKDWARFAIKDRFHYLRQLYTCMYEVSVNGGTCFDPLVYHYPTDDTAQADYTSTFIVANGIKVSPVLQKMGDGQKTFQSYFPKGNWVNLNNFGSIVKSTGQMVDLPSDQPAVHSHLKPGSLISYQQLLNSQGAQIRTTNELIDLPIAIIANRDENGYAGGSLFLDDGISRSKIQSSSFEYYTINHQAQSFQFQIAAGARGARDNYLEQFVVTNAEDLKYTSFACYQDVNNQIQQLSIRYDDITKSLYITPKVQVKFNQILNVYYGSDLKGDVNLCTPDAFNYKLVDGKMPDLTKSTASFQLTKVGGGLPDIMVNMRVLPNSIVNVQWNWVLDAQGNPPPGKKLPVPVPDDIISTATIQPSSAALKSFVSITDAPFQLAFKYRSSSNPSNVLTIKGLLFDSYYNYINVEATTLSGDNFNGVFGLGERANKDFFLRDGVYSMWSRDQPTPDENGQFPGNNMYGTHPYFMYKHKQGAWVGVLYKLAQAQDWWVKNDKTNGKVSLTTIATGGIADIYVMQGQTPDAVVANYFTLIGKPVLVPQWAYGWNHCRWGYTTVDAQRRIPENYDKYGIPMDVQWSDIDYLQDYRDFTFDHNRFDNLPKFIEDLHDTNRRYVPILDAGIAYRPGSDYGAFNEAQDKGLFMKAPNGETFIGQVWPNDAAYPDYANKDTIQWFQNQLTQLHDQIPFDGLWEDMNEASNFCVGPCYPRQRADKPVKYNLRYTPTGRDLEVKSMSLDTAHVDGRTQLDTHNFYGTLMVKATNDWFTNTLKRRTFIIERSSFAGMGKFSSRWLGDNFSDERFMGYSVSGTMLMNIFGIPFTGSDICGFIGDTTPELCARWHVVGAFYPFSRNHNNWGQIPQEPWVFQDTYEGNTKYMDIMNMAIRQKYALIRYYYTNLFLISTQGTGTFYKPLFFEFPDDPKAYNDITYNVMLGSALKLSINSEKLGQNTTTFYFPAGTWCDVAHPKTPCMVSPPGGQSVPLQTKAYDYYLHLRQGFIVPLQPTSDLEFKTSIDLQKVNVDLHVLGEITSGNNWRATGQYVNDDGTVLDLTNNFNGYNFVINSRDGVIQMMVIPNYLATNYQDPIDPNCNSVNRNDYLSKVYIYNAKAYGNNINYSVTATIKGATQPITLTDTTYDALTDRLILDIMTPLCITKTQTIDFAKKA